jgi:transcriptional regulator with XRE-family HTH domain
MSKEIRSPRHEALRKFLKLERQKVELAQRLGWDQTTISDIETGAKRVTAIELIQLGKALGFNPGAALNPHREGAGMIAFKIRTKWIDFGDLKLVLRA